MDFSKQPPSKQWAALNYKREKFAEVWFKPEGEPFVVSFRIPQKSFQIAGMEKELTIANLLLAVAINPEDVESWRLGDVAHPNPDLAAPLAPPPPDAAQLEIHVRLKPPSAAVASVASEVSLATWQDLEARWKFIVGLEASIDGLRIGMETLLSQLEASLTKSLTVEEKIHASRADVSQWTKAKHRVHVTLPKVKDIIHRAVWAIGSPERKRLEAIYKDHIQPRVPFPEMAAVLAELESLQKARQVLSALGMTVNQEARTISAEVNAALRTLQSNAASNAQKKKGAASGGKFFKSVRKMTGP